MSNDASLPPLQSLAVFESAARHLSFTTAARELGTTQPAVSQQIRNLEANLGIALFVRIYRGVELTPAGKKLLIATQSSFKSLRNACEEIRFQPKINQINVATDFAFAAFGLMPRLSEFRQRYGDLFSNLDIRLQTSQTEVDLAGNDADLAIVFGAGQFVGYQSYPLASECVYPVCSPYLLQQHPEIQTFDALIQLPLLQLNDLSGNRWLNWESVAQANQTSLAQVAPIMESDNYTLLVQAAIAGQGVCLAWSPLLDNLIKEGSLVAFPQFSTRSNNGYHLVMPMKNEESLLVNTFVSWLQEVTQSELT